MLGSGRMYNSSQLSFEMLKNLCGAQDVRCYATEEQPLVGSKRHMGSSHCESFPMLEQHKYILEATDYLSKWMKHSLCCGRLEEFKKDDSGNHISML